MWLNRFLLCLGIRLRFFLRLLHRWSTRLGVFTSFEGSREEASLLYFVVSLSSIEVEVTLWLFIFRSRLREEGLIQILFKIWRLFFCQILPVISRSIMILFSMWSSVSRVVPFIPGFVLPVVIPIVVVVIIVVWWSVLIIILSSPVFKALSSVSYISISIETIWFSSSPILHSKGL